MKIYEITLPPHAVRDLLLAAAEEIKYPSRLRKDKAYQKKYWVWYNWGRPNLQLKPINRKQFTGQISPDLLWYGFEINQAPYGSRIEIYQQREPFALAGKIVLFLITVLLFTIGLHALISLLVDQNFSLMLLGQSILFMSFLPLYLYLRHQFAQIAKADQAEMQELIDEMFQPYLYQS